MANGFFLRWWKKRRHLLRRLALRTEGGAVLYLESGKLLLLERDA